MKQDLLANNKHQSHQAKVGKIIFSVFLYSLLIAVAFIMFFPTLWAVVTSLKPETEVLEPGFHLLPRIFTLQNYKEVLTSEHDPILRWFLNSAVIALLYVILYLMVTSMAAYAFSRLKFKGREPIFWICMVSMMIPGVINLVPNYVIIERLGLLDNLFAMVLPGLSGVFGVFLLRQFMKNISREYDEVAMIDGANKFVIYSQIILPMCIPALVTLAIFSFQGNWNDFLWPLLVTSEKNNRTLTAGLYIFQNSYAHKYAHLMAGAVLSAIPVLIIFLLGQKQLTKGITIGGLKG